ncbi:hypothetical protein GSI_13227 [Ganoderma sinense ZZ0214-1]|uniref:Uncharacterized protein n=1 Tax=Ganoderma sinense ZZ0214-1 TaxID=1077348 RepID=A0A2G8RVI5_9APHY|nr:hypothetical protein GSI_13227 [Ganoderma sinense ZZ0214-1]
MEPQPYETPLVELALVSSWLAFQWEHGMSDGLADLLAVFSASPLTHLEVVGLCAPVSAETWATVFRMFPSLVSLDAGAEAEGALFAGLREAESESACMESVAWGDCTEAGSRIPACRGLERISVTPYSGLSQTPEQILEPLIHCLRYRAERGIRVKQLYLDLNMRIDGVKRYLPQLEDLVSNVKVKCRRTS